MSLPLLLLLALAFAAIPFVLPIVIFVSSRRLRARVQTLEEAASEQSLTIAKLEGELSRLKASATREPKAEPSVGRQAPEAATPAPRVAPSPVVGLPPAPPVTQVRADRDLPKPAAEPPPKLTAEPPRDVRVPPPPPPALEKPMEEVLAAAAMSRQGSVYDPPPPRSFVASFDWENLVGVKLFSIVSGVALVLAAIFFLKYSLDHGWLSPAVRVAIGVAVATALLVVCERKAARQYPITANALDAAAVSILFATFFAAHALWNLIPAVVTFVLLAVVTVLAVLLSIRRDSIFIALLGLLGGFSTPALLSTGENRPVPLFAYLLLLNLGLAVVSYRKGWPLLTLLTLVFTTLYQWGWVAAFLSVSQLPLAMSIFLVFSVFGALTLGRRTDADTASNVLLEKAGVAAAAMPLVFAVFLAAVPRYGANTALLFGFLLLIDAGLLAVALGQRDERLHAIGGGATILTFAIWLATSYAAGAWTTAMAFAAAFVAFYALAPIAADRAGRSFEGIGRRVVYAAPLLLFVFPVIVRIEPATASPALAFATLMALMALIAWRSLATPDAGLYFLAAGFALLAEASWSATHLTPERWVAVVVLHAAFGLLYFAVPLAWRLKARGLEPSWGGGAVLLASLVLLLFLASGPQMASAAGGLAILLVLLNVELFAESAARRLPVLSAAAGAISWYVLSVWWMKLSAIAQLDPLVTLLLVVAYTLLLAGGHAWLHGATSDPHGTPDPSVLTLVTARHGVFLTLVAFAFFVAGSQRPDVALPPWPLFGALAVTVLAITAAALVVSSGPLHAAGVTAAAVTVVAFAAASPDAWSPIAVAAAEAVVVYALGAYLVRPERSPQPLAIGAACALFLAEITAAAASSAEPGPPVAVLAAAHAFNVSWILAVAWQQRWRYVAPAAVLPAFAATLNWAGVHNTPDQWSRALALALPAYLAAVAYPFVLGRRAQDSRDPYFTAIAGSVLFFFAARYALEIGQLGHVVGIVPVVEGIVLALLLKQLLQLQPEGSRDLGRLAVVAGAALGFATVAIPLQLDRQWITIGWALEGAALAWLYQRVPHRGLLYSSVALLAVVFVRLVLNPEVFVYEPRGMRVLNWYLYAYLTCGAAFLLAAWLLSKTDDDLPRLPRASSLLAPGGAILLFFLLNIEIADFYATGPAITFRFGVSIAQDLTYTIGWLMFGLGLLVCGIYLQNRAARGAAVAFVAVTTSKAFLYDLASLGGLHRVASLVGLALSLALVAVALQKFVLKTKGTT